MKLKLFILLFSICIFSCTKNSGVTTPVKPVPVDTVAVVNITRPDHIIFVWFENKNYKTVIDSNYAPYISSLVSKGTLFTNMFAITHPSFPNYIDFFAGDANGVKDDKCVEPGSFSTPNLFTALKSVGKTFAWYSEGLPEIGSTICSKGNYYAKHNPTTIFSNVPASANKPFESFPTDYSKLENVVCISPDIYNDMHNGSSITSSITTGDKWLQENLSSLAEWCLTHNSIFVVYFDENENDGVNIANQIPVVAVGEHVKTNYQDTTLYDHYNWTRTVSEMFAAPNDWTTNLSSRSTINSCWK